MHNSLKSLLDSIEVGDSIWVVSYVNQSVYRRVIKVTKTTITASGGYKFERRNGTGIAADSLYKIGAKCSPDGCWYLFSDNDIKEMEQSRKTKYRRQVIMDTIEDKIAGFNDSISSNDIAISSIYAILFPYDEYSLVPLSEVAN